MINQDMETIKGMLESRKYVSRSAFIKTKGEKLPSRWVLLVNHIRNAETDLDVFEYKSAKAITDAICLKSDIKQVEEFTVNPAVTALKECSNPCMTFAEIGIATGVKSKGRNKPLRDAMNDGLIVKVGTYRLAEYCLPGNKPAAIEYIQVKSEQTKRDAVIARAKSLVDLFDGQLCMTPAALRKAGKLCTTSFTRQANVAVELGLLGRIGVARTLEYYLSINEAEAVEEYKNRWRLQAENTKEARKKLVVTGNERPAFNHEARAVSDGQLINDFLFAAKSPVSRAELLLGTGLSTTRYQAAKKHITTADIKRISGGRILFVPRSIKPSGAVKTDKHERRKVRGTGCMTWRSVDSFDFSGLKNNLAW